MVKLTEIEALKKSAEKIARLNEYFQMVEKGWFGVIEFYQDKTGGQVRGVNQDGSSDLLLTLLYSYAVKQFESRAGLNMASSKKQAGEFKYGSHDKQVRINICSRPNRFCGKDITLSL